MCTRSSDVASSASSPAHGGWKSLAPRGNGGEMRSSEVRRSPRPSCASSTACSTAVLLGYCEAMIPAMRPRPSLWRVAAAWQGCHCLMLTLRATSGSLFQSVVAIANFESANYIEHYGLERRTQGGTPEPPGYHHSWDSAHTYTNVLLFKLQRHADHHVNSGRRYQCLRTHPRAPVLPSGYPGCILLSWCPPLWRAVMHPRLMQHRARLTRETGQVWRHGPQPAARGLCEDVASPADCTEMQ